MAKIGQIPIKVFIADDFSLLLRSLRALLNEDRNLEVVGDATNGRAAVEQVRKLRPDVAILDIGMPELNGIEAARRIREFSPTIGIIMYSAHASIEYVNLAFRAGANGYVVKASAADELLDAVRAVYEGKRYLCRIITPTIIDTYINGLALDQPPGTTAAALAPRTALRDVGYE